MTFPKAHSVIYRNEAGEVTGWDNPSENDAMANYCDACGISHTGECYDPYDDEDPGVEDEDPGIWGRGV